MAIIKTVAAQVAGMVLKGLPSSKPEPEPDLTFDNVQEFLVWAEGLQHTPGLVHGEKRKAAGIELIRRGVDVLRGRVSCPNDMKKRLKVYSPQGAK